jgi:WD40 repeat protein
MDLEPESRVGGYRLIRVVGEGGFGVVYLAEQLEPVKRLVALKIIKLGMDTRQVVGRFQAERQALALMDHPGIARVFDAGATETGRPYFVMEFVEGVPITRYADQQRLSIAERLELFMKVCDAVQHAHQKGVIHRDLKPSNILVAAQQGQATPKIIDFGLAKATHAELTDKSLITQFQQLIGTPAYMSPEQVEWGAVDVDTRSDIYSLGVLLYELLTGTTPFDTRELLRGGMAETARRIREQDPPRPSARLRSANSAELAAVARRRHVSPEKLPGQVQGDLDCIVMKALEKNRMRRYETANALALDIRRHLSSEPVRARPPTALYQFQKLVGRNKLVFASAAAVVAALAIGLGIASVALVKERLARQLASNRAEESRQRLVRLNVATGNKLVDEGDDFNALLWFVEALRLDEGDAARSDVHRRRIGSILRRAPQLTHLWWHEDGVLSVQFSPDGQRVASASWDRTARIWDARTGLLAAPIFRNDTRLQDVRFTLDGRRILTMDVDGRVRLWDAQTGQPFGPALPTAAHWEALDLSRDGRWFLAGVTNGVQLFDATNGAALGPVIPMSNIIHVLRFSPDGRSALAGGEKEVARILEMPSGRTRWKLAGTAGLQAAGFSPDARRVATVTLRELLVWDTSTGELAWPATRPGGDLMACQFSPDSQWLGVASWNRFARLFDAATGVPVGVPMRHPNPVSDCPFSPDGRWLMTASRDGTARVWRPQTGEPLSPPLPHASGVFAVGFAPDSARLVTSSQDHSVRVWDLCTNAAARLSLRHPQPVRRVQFSPEGTRLLTVADDTEARIWDAQSGALLVRLPHQHRVVAASFSHDGQRVVTGTSGGSVSLWDARRAVELIPTLQLSNGISEVAFSPDGQRFLTAGGERARVWSALTGEAVTAWLTHSNSILHAAFSPDGRRVVTAGLDSIAQIWDAQTGAPVCPPMKHPSRVAWAAFSPEGRRVVTACDDPQEVPRFAQVWDAETGHSLGPPLRHDNGVTHAEFSPDGKRVVTASTDDHAMIWDSQTGQALVAQLQHQDDLPHAFFSPDGRLLLTVSFDHTARVWDGMTGAPVTAPLAHEGRVLFGAWSPSGREVATGGDDGTVRVWDVSPSPATLTQLRREAELLSAHRIEADLGSVPLTAEEMKQRWAERKRP